MKVALLTHYLPTERENYQQLADLTVPNRDAYCKRHGYEHIVHSGVYGDASLYYAVQRIHLLFDIFDRTDAPDLVWVLNVQAVITNPAIPVTQFVDDHDFFIHADINGLNAGSFLIRRSDWSRSWLSHILAETARSTHCWHEQKAMIESYRKPEWASYIKVLEHPAINSYQYSRYGRGPETPGDWRPDHLCLSLPGLSLQERLDIVRPMLNPTDKPSFPSTFKPIMISAWHEQFGNGTLRMLDGHPSLLVYPFESQISTAHSTSIISEEFVPNRYRYPAFTTEMTPEQAYAAIWDQELKTYLRTPHLSKFKDCGIVMDEVKRIEAFKDVVCDLSMGQFKGALMPVHHHISRADYVEAFFRSTFAAWENLNRSGTETHYVGYSPPILFNADAYFSDFPEGQMIHVIRNPFSGFGDTLKRPFPMSLEKYAQVWNLTQLTALTYANKYKGRFHIVFFEEIAGDTEATMYKLLDKLGLPCSDKVLYPSFNGTKMEQVYPWGTVRFLTTEANVATANELSQDQSERIATECGVMLRQLGYLRDAT